MRDKIQKCFDFKIELEYPYKLCDYRVAYGEIFKEELKNYDFWGYCDIDLLWGNIRKFYTDEILSSYEKIGFQGHSTLYKNTPSVNALYKTKIDAAPTYREIFTSNKNLFFDEDIICKIYGALGVKYFKETVFAHLNRYSYGFYLKFLDPRFDYKNKRQIFALKDGTLTRMYLDGGSVKTEEFMYIHFFSRPMEVAGCGLKDSSRYVIIPNKIIEDNETELDSKYIKRYGKKGALSHYWRCFIQHRKKITPRKLLSALKNQIKNAK
ncbi:MAG: hypothetical protein J6T16_04930 [Opitutales bacterium]|nr:hypothetical protein [Opitutales bacterium]